MGLDAEALYAIEHYKKIKDTPEFLSTPEPKVSTKFKKEVDALDLKSLKDKYPYLWNPVPGNHLSIEAYFQSDKERQEEMYVVQRYYELLDQMPVSERSPTFTQDFVDYVNRTGLHPFTGEEAADDVKFMARHHNTVQSLSTLGATVAASYMDWNEITQYSSNAKGYKVDTDFDVPDGKNIQQFKYESKYTDLYDYEFNGRTNSGPLAEHPSMPNRNFYGGRYDVKVSTEDRILYRAGNSENPMGQWFTSEPPKSRAQVRIDTAVKDIWLKPDGSYSGQSPVDTVYKIKIPKGTLTFEGPVGSQGSIYQGGLDKNQIFIDSPWNLENIEVIDSWPITK